MNKLWTLQIDVHRHFMKTPQYDDSTLSVIISTFPSILGLQYEGRDLKIDLSEPRTGERAERPDRPKAVRTPSENSVFVGNLGEHLEHPLLHTLHLWN